MCEKHVFYCVGSEQKWSMGTDGSARGFQYDEGKIRFFFLFCRTTIVGLRIGSPYGVTVLHKVFAGILLVVVIVTRY